MRTAALLIKEMRPKQWTKNLLVFAALVFSGNMTNVRDWSLSIVAFVVFVMLSGAVYVFNDVADVEADRHHARKRSRPIASGELSARLALAVAVIVAVLASLGGFLILGPWFLAVSSAYLAVQVAYTIGLKRLVILDVMTIAAGFVLRALAGAVAIGVAFSPWLLACTGLLALFLALGKRRHELLLLEDSAPNHRASLEGYSREFIDQLMSTVTAATIVAYSLYTFFSVTGERRPWLILTVPFVVYGMFRYLYLVYRQGLGGDPEEILLTDTPLVIDIGLFLLVAGATLYLK